MKHANIFFSGYNRRIICQKLINITAKRLHFIATIDQPTILVPVPSSFQQVKK